MVCWVSVVGRNELVAMLTLVRSTGAVMVRTENAEGRMELDTALRDNTYVNKVNPLSNYDAAHKSFSI